MRIRDERLPWLADEPAPVPAGPDTRTRSGRRGMTRAMWPWYLALALLVAAVAAGAWWLGTRQREAPPPQLAVEEPTAIPLSPIEETTNAVVAGPLAELPVEALPSQAPAGPARPESAQESEPAAGVLAQGEGELATAPPEEDVVQVAARGRSVFPAEETVAVPPPATGPAPVVVGNARLYRGRVVQLGAFPSRAQAEETWRRVTRRFPYLASKPKMVNTVEVRGLGGGRGTRMYRLQLGTSSQAQSAVICQQLERVRQSCVVVY
jgi:hypothetical protein